MRDGISITVKPSERRRLKAVLKNRNAPQKHVWRAQIVLFSAEGLGTKAIMRRTGKSKLCVWRWQERFMEEGVDGLLRDKTRKPGKAPLGADVAERVVALTLSTPPGETTHWTGAMMAKASGISVSAVQRIWREHGLRPHKIEQFKLSNDPRFVDKLRDVVGLYVNPPDHAIVLSVDEKSQIQALDRTQPGLPMKKGRAGTMTHDYKRNGTTTLFAALNVLEGKVIGRCMQRHRHQELIRFLNATETEVPAKKAVHVILDNYATHKHPEVLAWLARHKRSTFHFTPASCSWLNAVEGYFAKLSRRRLKRGVFKSVADLQDAIDRFVAETNENPKPFVWTKNPDKIIAAVKRGHQMLDSVHSRPMAGRHAIDLALDLARMPALARASVTPPIPPDVVDLMRIAAANPEACQAAVAKTGEPRSHLIEAARFYLQQVLFRPEADCYRILGIEPTASRATARNNMRWLLQWLHPDRNSSWDAVYAERVLKAWHEVSSERSLTEAGHLRAQSATNKKKRRSEFANIRLPWIEQSGKPSIRGAYRIFAIWAILGGLLVVVLALGSAAYYFGPEQTAAMTPIR